MIAPKAAGIIDFYSSSGMKVDKYNEFYNNRSGFGLGVFGNYHFINLFSLTVQLQYAQKGYTEKQDETGETGNYIQTVEANTRLDYLSVPILAKIEYSNLAVTPYALVGPRFDYLVNKRNGIYKFSSG